MLKVWNGTEWKIATARAYTTSYADASAVWRGVNPKVWNGSEWKPISYQFWKATGTEYSDPNITGFSGKGFVFGGGLYSGISTTVPRLVDGSGVYNGTIAVFYDYYSTTNYTTYSKTYFTIDSVGYPTYPDLSRMTLKGSTNATITNWTIETASYNKGNGTYSVVYRNTNGPYFTGSGTTTAVVDFYPVY